MEMNLIRFNENITNITKEICKYEDEKGNVVLVNTNQLLVSCEFKQLDDKEFEKAVFEKIVDNTKEYEETEITKPRSKYDFTHKEKDKLTIVDTQVKVKNIWLVRNSLGLVLSFNNKEEAVSLVNEINNKYIELMK